MTVTVGIKRGNFGGSYKFLVKNVDYSAYTASIYVESSGGTMLVDNDGVLVSATDNNKNTLVTYVPASGTFGLAASLVKYNAEITFRSGTSFMESTKSFIWQVHDEFR